LLLKIKDELRKRQDVTRNIVNKIVQKGKNARAKARNRKQRAHCR